MEEKIEDLKITIINELDENFLQSDEEVLEKILTRGIKNALFISNRAFTKNNLDVLEDEIISFVKTIYLQRGTEDVDSISTSGRTSSFKKANVELKNSIISNNKRVMK